MPLDQTCRISINVCISDIIDPPALTVLYDDIGTRTLVPAFCTTLIKWDDQTLSTTYFSEYFGRNKIDPIDHV